MSKNYVIPVKILAINSQGLILELLAPQEDCPRCKGGEGCGSFPWFQGFSQRNTLLFPFQTYHWQQGDIAQVVISSQAASYIAMFTYGLPLAGFLLGLFLGQSLPESQQVSLATLMMGLVMIFSRISQKIWVKKFILLEKIGSAPPQSVRPKLGR